MTSALNFTLKWRLYAIAAIALDDIINLQRQNSAFYNSIHHVYGQAS